MQWERSFRLGARQMERWPRSSQPAFSSHCSRDSNHCLYREQQSSHDTLAAIFPTPRSSAGEQALTENGLIFGKKRASKFQTGNTVSKAGRKAGHQGFSRFEIIATLPAHFGNDCTHASLPASHRPRDSPPSGAVLPARPGGKTPICASIVLRFDTADKKSGRWKSHRSEMDKPEALVQYLQCPETYIPSGLENTFLSLGVRTETVRPQERRLEITVGTR
jgi:hypothetical protein